MLRKYAIPGDGNWDYVRADSVNRRLYVSHGMEVDVLNLDTGEIVGKLMPPKGGRQVAHADPRSRCCARSRLGIYQ